MKWEYSRLDADGTDEQVHAYLEELRLLSHRMSIASNRYAVAAVFAEAERHQREYTVPFRVDAVLKGTVDTNDIELTYTRAITREDLTHPFKTNVQYVLFLAHRYSDAQGHHFLPSFGAWSPWGCFRVVSTNYVIHDEWETTEIGKPFKPLAVWTKQHHGQRTLTHEQFITRIKELVKKQETTIEFTVAR